MIATLMPLTCREQLIAVTTTRNRSHVFNNYCTRWIANQTFRDFTWLVVNDSDRDQQDQYQYLPQTIVVRRPPTFPLHSLCMNWLTALEHVGTHHHIAVVEDDDWISANFLAEMNRMLDQADLCGFSNDGYFHVQGRRSRRMHNVDHASLAATGFTSKVLPLLREIASEGDPFIDMRLWARWPGSRLLLPNFGPDGKAHHVGIKGQWHGGEQGISTLGHAAGGGDTPLWRLREWMGQDADVYFQAAQD